MVAVNKRRRGISWDLSFAFEGRDISRLVCDAYKVMIEADSRAKKTFWDYPAWDDFFIEARCRSNIFFALAAVKSENYSGVLEEINRSFLN